MTNLDLRAELREMLECILSEASRGVSLAEFPPPKSPQKREEIVREFDIVKARVWGDVCRCLTLAEEVEQAVGLTDENVSIVLRIREIHDVLVRGDWPK